MGLTVSQKIMYFGQTNLLLFTEQVIRQNTEPRRLTQYKFFVFWEAGEGSFYNTKI